MAAPAYSAGVSTGVARKAARAIPLISVGRHEGINKAGERSFQATAGGLLSNVPIFITATFARYLHQPTRL